LRKDIRKTADLAPGLLTGYEPTTNGGFHCARNYELTEQALMAF